MVRRDLIKLVMCLAYCCMIFLMVVFSVQADKYPVKLGVYKQEVVTVYGLQEGLPSIEATAVAIASDGQVYAGTKKGLAALKDGRWSVVHGAAISALAMDGERLLASAGKDLISVGKDGVKSLAKLPSGEPLGMTCRNGVVYLAMSTGLYRMENGPLTADDGLNGMLGEKKHIYSVAVDDKGTVAVGAESGLFRKEAGQNWTALYPIDKSGRSWAPRSVRGVAFDSKGRLWFAGPQGVGCHDGAWTLYEGKDGLPLNDFTTMCAGEDGVVWFGTQMGAIRFDGQKWAYRQGRAWLPNDKVHAMAVNQNGDAWFATPGGVGVIERRPMTLAEKAAFYEDEMEKYIRRTEYGYVSEVGLGSPGDKSEIHYSDSDNDGLWTSMYGAGECFAYAATKDPKAKDRAKRAFEALRFLSVAPVGGEVPQQPGYVARTIVPTTEPNPNSHYTLEGQQRNRATRDSLWKVYSPRYPLTEDKKYWYKTDVSSDELDGHYFFYPAYYDLVADTPEEKERVREVVRNITDHLIRNDFCMIDHDGTPTRWAIYSPTSLNHDHNWYAERGLKSLSILSYLAVAEHVTDDPKYGEDANRLRQEHAFDTNIMIPKVNNGIGSGNQSDDEMFFMCFYNLVKYTKDDTLRERVTFAFYEHWVREFPEMNPFFNFAYAASGMKTQYTDPWGTHDLSPWNGWLTDSIDTLEGFPLDRCNWARQNSHRLDLVFLEPQAAFESYGGDRINRGRGYLVNGKVLPVQERYFNHWNTDPWELDYGGNGQGLASGAVFLLPYYMGLYHKFIE